MSITLEILHKELHEMKISIEKIKNILEEGYELSSVAKKELDEARKTPNSKYVSQKDVGKRFLNR